MSARIAWTLVAMALVLALGERTAMADTDTGIEADAEPDSDTDTDDDAEPDSDTDTDDDAEPDSDSASDPDLHRVTRNALLMYPFAFARRGFAFAYERAFPRTGLSVLARLAYDRQAGGDFRSNAVAIGAEGRWYFLARGPFTKYAGRAPLGPFLGARGQWMSTRLRTEQRFVGSAHRLTWETSFGFRMVVAGIVDLTPYLSASFNSDVLDGLGPDIHASFGFGLCVGILFERRSGESDAAPAISANPR